MCWKRGSGRRSKPAQRERVLLLGHLDTVWPLGTLKTMPCRVRDGRSVGPRHAGHEGRRGDGADGHRDAGRSRLAASAKSCCC